MAALQQRVRTTDDRHARSPHLAVSHVRVEPLAAAPASFLEKRSGGWHGRTTKRIQWQRRYFVLNGSTLQYWRNFDEHDRGIPALGGLTIEHARVLIEPNDRETASKVRTRNSTAVPPLRHGSPPAPPLLAKKSRQPLRAARPRRARRAAAEPSSLDPPNDHHTRALLRSRPKTSSISACSRRSGSSACARGRRRSSRTCGGRRCCAPPPPRQARAGGRRGSLSTTAAGGAS